MDEPQAAEGQPPRQARGNGLTAPAWVPLRDVDPRMTVPLLDALRDADVAAYVAPAGSPAGFALEVRLPRMPTDRLWVDARRKQEAAAVVDTALPVLEAGLADDDWAGIVAMFGSRTAQPTGVPVWPAAEDVDAPENGDASSAVAAGGAQETDGLDYVAGYDDYDVVPDDPEDHFVPPDPPLPPRSDTVTRYGWALLLGGLGLLVVPVLLGWSLGSGWGLIGILAVISGFGTLVYRMKDSPPTDSGPDDGAVV